MKRNVMLTPMVISGRKQDGAALDAPALKQGITATTYQTLFNAVLDDGSGAIYGQQGNSGFAIDSGNGIVALSMAMVATKIESRRRWDGERGPRVSNGNAWRKAA